MINGPLDPQFVEWSLTRGRERTNQSREQGLVEVSHSGGVSGSFDGEGRLGEDVVAAVMGLSYPPIGGTYKTLPDVGPLEVQSVLVWKGTKGDNLLIRPSDGVALERPYVLVHLDAPDGTAQSARAYKLCGWMIGSDAPERCFRVLTGGGNPCWVVSPAKLEPFDTRFFEWLESWKQNSVVI